MLELGGTNHLPGTAGLPASPAPAVHASSGKPPGAATETDVKRRLAGRVLSLIIVGIVIVISVSGAWLPEAVTGVLYICQHSSFYDL